jgi:hypothetical protein
MGCYLPSDDKLLATDSQTSTGAFTDRPMLYLRTFVNPLSMLKAVLATNQ